MARPGELGITRCGWMELRWGERTYVMGILNVTPDSFSGDGLAESLPALIERARNMAAQEADMIRVYGVSFMVRVDRMADAIVRGDTASPVTAYLGLGSNMGNREYNIKRALGFLGQRVRVEKVSSLYETEPVGFREQPLFLNAACQVSTELSPQDLLSLAKAIEGCLGRVPSFPNTPRPIDIDILLYGDRTLDTPLLTIPHPSLRERAFALIPLAEIAAEVMEPRSRLNIGHLAAGVARRESVHRWK